MVSETYFPPARLLASSRWAAGSSGAPDFSPGISASAWAAE